MENDELLQMRALAFSDEIQRYVSCMLDIKRRMKMIRDLLANGSTLEEKEFDFQIICLQYRSIFELIYLSSLAAHKKQYEKGYDKLKKEWSMRAIKKFLDKVNPDFYPNAATYKIDNSTDEPSIDITPMPQGFLLKEELEEIAEICNDFIHPRNPFADENNYVSTWANFPIWYHKITNLLTTHVVSLFKSKQGIFVHIDFGTEPASEKDIFAIYLQVDQTTIH